MSKLSGINIHMQRHLFPAIEEEIGVLSPKEKQFIRILELVEVQPFLAGQAWCGTGRPPHSRVALARAFIAKAVWNIPTTRGLIDYISSSPSLRRLCGWDSVSGIPHESVFSRAFELFALRELPANIHKTLVEEHLGERLCGHLSRDSTAIEGREKPVQKKKSRKLRKKGDAPAKAKNAKRKSAASKSSPDVR